MRSVLPLVSFGGGSGGGYTAKAVHFDGMTGLGLTNQSAGLATDAFCGLLGVWLNGADVFAASHNGTLFEDNNLQSLFANGGGRPANTLNVNLQDVSGNDFLTVHPSAALPSTWTWLGMSWNTNFASGSRVFQMLYGDSSQSLVTDFDSGIAFLNNYSDTQWTFFSTISSPPLNAMTADVADFQFWAGGSFVDLTVTANRRNFIDGSGNPVNPATAATAFGTQTVLFSGDHTAFPTNQGSGGATSVLVGALTNASTHP